MNLLRLSVKRMCSIMKNNAIEKKLAIISISSGNKPKSTKKNLVESWKRR